MNPSHITLFSLLCAITCLASTPTPKRPDPPLPGRNAKTIQVIPITQGMGAMDLISPRPPPAVYFVAEAVDENGLVSDNSAEVVYPRSTVMPSPLYVTLAWDRPNCTNKIVDYLILRGRRSGVYTHTNHAGTNLIIREPLR